MIKLTTRQKRIIAFVCFAIAIVGFMLRLPSVFRYVDKELHAAFYFLAAALLNVLFTGTRLISHFAIFIFLFLFGVAIEYTQAYSNKFFGKRLHGRFDPEDIDWNVKGLIAFSACWFLFTIIRSVYKKAASKPRL